MSNSSKSPKSPNKAPRLNRSVARLCAVQALYAIRMSDSPQDEVLADFHINRIPELTDEAGFQAPDGNLFAALVKGCEAEAADLDDLLSAVLADDWPLARLEALLHMLLRAAFYELAFCPDVPVRVVINEYVDLAHAFFSEGEPGMVNGLLDRLARELRVEELDQGNGKR
jgi:N utilization substance protein B